MGGVNNGGTFYKPQVESTATVLQEVVPNDGSYNTVPILFLKQKVASEVLKIYRNKKL